jgi:peroxiredoxin Q/BCP
MKKASKAKSKAAPKAKAKSSSKAKPKAQAAAKATTKKSAPVPKAKASKKKDAVSPPQAKATPKKSAPPPQAKANAKKTAPSPKASTKKSAPSPQAKASAAPPVSGLGEGDRAPEFSLPDQNGNVVSSASLAGQPYVLYFYPKDDTPGCTREACGFRDDHGKFTGAGARVIGVSPDSEKSHARFAEKYGLSFTLLSDAEKALANAYGVWVMKQNYGREYMGIERSTFVVGADGKIKKVFRRVKVDGHVPAVFAAL